MKDERVYLVHIRDAILRIDAYTAPGRVEFLDNAMRQDAVLRNLHTLAESTTHLSDATRTAHPEIAWRAVAGLRNVIVHDYLGVDLDRIWTIVEDDLPQLKAAVTALLESLPPLD